MAKSRSQLASELFTLRSTLPLWPKEMNSEPELFTFLDRRIKRLLSEADIQDRGYVLTRVNQMFATRGLERRYT
ncbi:hypothetical protein [Lysobacter sp. Hz 25]|uniref:hypothetical protein n=1 Tax=Lysobacter sp. Hz 25 TaxID=3383698 RepID=UPI0038D49DDD